MLGIKKEQLSLLFENISMFQDITLKLSIESIVLA